MSIKTSCEHYYLQILDLNQLHLPLLTKHGFSEIPQWKIVVTKIKPKSGV